MEKKWVIAVFVLLGALAFGRTPTGKYKTVVDTLRGYESAYPAFAKVFSIGTNDDGTEIYAVRISISPSKVDESKIGHLVVGTHHGNETKAPTLVLSFAEALLNRLENGAFWREDLDAIEWTLIPVLNVTGYNASRRREYGQDPNRDYPGPCTSSPGGRLGSVATLMDFLKTRVFSGSVTVHGYIGTLTYPWGVNTDRVETNDHNLFASAVGKAASENGYRHGTSTDLIYPAEGTYEDYVYWKHGMWSLLVELDSGSPSDIRDTTSAVEVFFSEIDASPSTLNAFEGRCLASRGLDLGIE